MPQPAHSDRFACSLTSHMQVGFVFAAFVSHFGRVQMLEVRTRTEISWGPRMKNGDLNPLEQYADV